MSFDDMVNNANAYALARFGKDITVKLSGATVAAPRVIFDQAVETVSPFETEEVVIRPAITAEDDKVAAFGADHRYLIGGTEYKAYGKPRPDGFGWTQIFLVKA